MPTVISKFVNTDSTAGGDGSTNGTSGATRAYASMSEAANAAEARGLVTNDEQWDVQCSAPSGVADTTPIDISTTTSFDATRFVRFFAAAGEECNGLFQTDRYRLDVNSSGSCIDLTGVPFVRWEDIAFRYLSSVSGERFLHITGTTGGQVRMIRCAIFSHASQAASVEGIEHIDSDTAGRYVNCIIAEFTDHGINISGSTASVFIYNCTSVDNGGTGIRTTGTNQRVKNCRATGNAVDFSGTTNASSTNNLSSDGTAPGSSPLTGQTPVYVDAANDDYHLAAGDPGIGQGDDLSADGTYPFSDDIDRDTRSSWDIGADERISGGGGSGFLATKFIAIV